MILPDTSNFLFTSHLIKEECLLNLNFILNIRIYISNCLVIPRWYTSGSPCSRSSSSPLPRLGRNIISYKHVCMPQQQTCTASSITDSTSWCGWAPGHDERAQVHVEDRHAVAPDTTRFKNSLHCRIFEPIITHQQ